MKTQKEKLLDVRSKLGGAQVSASEIMSAMTCANEPNAENIARLVIELRFEIEQKILLPIIEIQNDLVDAWASEIHHQSALHPPTSAEVALELFYSNGRDQVRVGEWINRVGIQPSTGSEWDPYPSWHQSFKELGIKTFLEHLE